MSITNDIAYLYKISHRLQFFKEVDTRLYNIRCCICGDSKKSLSKARGYFYEYRNSLKYKCHNCSISLSFYHFLEQLDPELVKEYTRDKFLEGKKRRNYEKIDVKQTKNLEKKFHFQKISNFLKPVMKSDSDLAKQYVKKRKLPAHRLEDVYYLHNPQKLIAHIPRYKKILLGLGKCLAMPFFDMNGDFFGMQCRTISETYKVYFNMKFYDDDVLVYNLNGINKNKRIYVLEGIFDSFFLPNSLAAVSSSLIKVEQILDAENLVYVYDNEPRNIQLLQQIEKTINRNRKVVVWPNNIKEKDINDMVLAGTKPNKILSFVDQNTFQGPRAMIEYGKWKKIST